MRIRTLILENQNFDYMLQKFPFEAVDIISMDKNNDVRKTFNDSIDTLRPLLVDRVRMEWAVKLLRIDILSFYIVGFDKKKQREENIKDDTIRIAYELCVNILNSYVDQYNYKRIQMGLEGNVVASLLRKSVEEPATLADWQHYRDISRWNGPNHEGIASIKRYVFSWQTPMEVIADLRVLEQAWAQEQKSFIRLEDQIRETAGMEIFIDFRQPAISSYQTSGWIWLNLNVNSSRLEANAMGHCASDNGTLLSLRKITKNNGHWGFIPYVTVAFHYGEIIQSKGRFNSKPGYVNSGKEKDHDFIRSCIINLLHDDRIEGLKKASYQGENDFSTFDLDNEEREELRKKRPNFFPIEDRWFEREKLTKDEYKEFTSFLSKQNNEEFELEWDEQHPKWTYSTGTSVQDAVKYNFDNTLTDTKYYEDGLGIPLKTFVDVYEQNDSDNNSYKRLEGIIDVSPEIPETLIDIILRNIKVLSPKFYNNLSKEIYKAEDFHQMDLFDPKIKPKLSKIILSLIKKDNHDLSYLNKISSAFDKRKVLWNLLETLALISVRPYVGTSFIGSDGEIHVEFSEYEIREHLSNFDDDVLNWNFDPNNFNDYVDDYEVKEAFQLFWSEIRAEYVTDVDNLNRSYEDKNRIILLMKELGVSVPEDYTLI